LALLAGGGIEEPIVESQAQTSVFPLIFQCPHCGKKLKTAKPGKFRCSGCKGIIAVDDIGKVGTA
jgi:tRNA(Ile2) C34 agmatinyltransferase TiaS